MAITNVDAAGKMSVQALYDKITELELIIFEYQQLSGFLSELVKNNDATLTIFHDGDGFQFYIEDDKNAGIWLDGMHTSQPDILKAFKDFCEFTGEEQARIKDKMDLSVARAEIVKG